jgi:hypothetical protein
VRGTYGSRDYSTNVSPRYVEMLLQQQEWLISGLLKLYSRTQIGSDRSLGLPMEGKSRRKSVHYILEQLGVLDDQNRTALEPVAAPSSDQQRCGVSGDAFEDRCGPFDSIQSESFPHSPTTAASDGLPMLVSGDPCSAFFQFPSLGEEESDSTIWIQDSDIDLSCFQPWCRDALVSGYERPFGNGMAAKMQNWFESPVPAAVHGDLGFVFIKDTTQATQSAPPTPFRPVPGSRKSGSHCFFSKVAFASMQGNKRPSG